MVFGFEVISKTDTNEVFETALEGDRKADQDEMIRVKVDEVMDAMRSLI